MSAAARPESAAAVADALRAGAPLAPRGGGTHQHLAESVDGAQALDLTALDQVVDYQPADLTVTVQAGVPLARLQALLAERGQWVALEAAQPERATVGGILASAWAGPLRLGYGRPRDQVLGVRFVTGDGVPAKAGGRVVKNVAGYDVCRLLVGSLGSLAVITEVTLKVRPRPEREESLTADFGAPAEAVMAARAIRETAWLPTLLTLHHADRALRLLVGSDGDAAAVAAQTAALRAILEAHGAEAAVHTATESDAARARLRAAAMPGDSVALRVSLRFTDLDVLLTEVGERAATIVAHLGSGVAHLQFAAVDDARAARAFAEARGGAAVVEGAAPPELPRWGAPRPDASLTRRLKQAFDPRGVLPPGPFTE